MAQMRSGQARSRSRKKRRAINGHEVIVVGTLLDHLRQVFHIDVDIAGFIGFEGTVFRLLYSGLQVAQVSRAIPTQSAVQARQRDIRL